MKFYISAYASSPSPKVWNSKLEEQFFHSLARNHNVIGVEHPFLLNSERYSESWLSEHIPNHWSIIITTLPTFMEAMRFDISIGLASNIEKGRYKALNIMEKLANYIKSLNKRFGRKIVSAIHIHSAPKNSDFSVLGNKLQLQKSLNDLNSIDFDGSDINLEHCDAYIPNQINENKGFLGLADEIEAIENFSNRYGIVINWGRSAIEGRSVDTPLKHIELASQYNLLKGIFFSGVSNVSKEYGIWKDTHMPLEVDENIIKRDSNLVKLLENSTMLKGCLLNYLEIERILKQINNKPGSVMSKYYGIKVSNLDMPVSLQQSLAINCAAISMLINN